MVDVVLMQHIADADANRPAPDRICKWDALRALAVARQVYGLSDRDLSVLQALLIFHPGTELDPRGNLVVHPSNRAICARLNGMANSPMRRHLARLVDAGILVRRDSPNGKRYARRHGAEKIAFGFDLAPLLRRFAEFQAAAAEVEATEAEIRQLRETVSLMRRDLAAQVATPELREPLRQVQVLGATGASLGLRVVQVWSGLRPWEVERRGCTRRKRAANARARRRRRPPARDR